MESASERRKPGTNHRPLDAAGFTRWFLSRGGAVGSAAIGSRNGLRGLHATRDIAPGELLVRAPRSLYITAADRADSPMFSRLLQLEGLSEQALLSARLADIRREGGRWKAMIDALPRSFRERPDGYSRHDWNLLQGSHAQWRARDARQRLCAEYRLVRDALAGIATLSLREFAWGHLVAATRAFGLQVDGRTVAGLVPMADMLNHSNEPNCDLDGDHSRFLDVRANRDVRAGEQLTCSYGDLPDTSLLARYGFCLGENPHNRATFRLACGPGHWLREGTKAANRDGGPLLLGIGHSPSDRHGVELMTFMRLAALPPSRAAAVDAMLRRHHLDAVPMLHSGNERDALHLLAATCTHRLAEFSCGIEEDDALLAGGGLTPDQRNAVIVRRGEKRLLLQTMTMARQAAARLAVPGYSASLSSSSSGSSLGGSIGGGGLGNEGV